MDKKDKLQKSLEKNLPGVKKSEIIIANKDKKDIKDDYELARTTYKDLIQTGMRSLDVLAELARESEHPRAFEVLSRAIKDVGDTTDKLMELQKNKKALNKEEEETEKKRLVTNNNLFVGSTADLQKMILDKDFIDAED
ncbi:MAG: hypothetical protein CBD47_08505 [Synechococcus sp. TMED187]|nr:MAG: hypothetical protein CBD47_08505 [Synechococcus sp. TMED187]